MMFGYLDAGCPTPKPSVDTADGEGASEQAQETSHSKANCLVMDLGANGQIEREGVLS